MTSVWAEIVAERMLKAAILAEGRGYAVRDVRAALEALDEIKWRVFVLLERT